MDRAELERLVWVAIEDEWDSMRPEGGVGTTHSRNVYERLRTEGVEVPPGAMNDILADLHNKGLIRGAGFHDREGIREHGARAIIEPEWRSQ
jgi:hypothetical protein